MPDVVFATSLAGLFRSPLACVPPRVAENVLLGVGLVVPIGVLPEVLPELGPTPLAVAWACPLATAFLEGFPFETLGIGLGRVVRAGGASPERRCVAPPFFAYPGRSVASLRDLCTDM